MDQIPSNTTSSFVNPYLAWTKSVEGFLQSDVSEEEVQAFALSLASKEKVQAIAERLLTGEFNQQTPNCIRNIKRIDELINVENAVEKALNSDHLPEKFWINFFCSEGLDKLEEKITIDHAKNSLIIRVIDVYLSLVEKKKVLDNEELLLSLLNKLKIHSFGSYEKIIIHALRNDLGYVFRYLIENENDFDIIDQDGVSLLHIYAEKGDLDKLKSFEERGADLFLIDKKNNNLLHYAVQSKNKELVCWLIQKGVDLFLFNSHFKTPLGLADWEFAKTFFEGFGFVQIIDCFAMQQQWYQKLSTLVNLILTPQQTLEEVLNHPDVNPLKVAMLLGSENLAQKMFFELPIEKFDDYLQKLKKAFPKRDLYAVFENVRYDINCDHLTVEEVVFSEINLVKVFPPSLLEEKVSGKLANGKDPIKQVQVEELFQIFDTFTFHEKAPVETLKQTSFASSSAVIPISSQSLSVRGQSSIVERRSATPFPVLTGLLPNNNNHAVGFGDYFFSQSDQEEQEEFGNQIDNFYTPIEENDDETTVNLTPMFEQEGVQGDISDADTATTEEIVSDGDVTTADLFSSDEDNDVQPLLSEFADSSNSNSFEIDLKEYDFVEGGLTKKRVKEGVTAVVEEAKKNQKIKQLLEAVIVFLNKTNCMDKKKKIFMDIVISGFLKAEEREKEIKFIYQRVFVLPYLLRLFSEINFSDPLKNDYFDLSKITDDGSQLSEKILTKNLQKLHDNFFYEKKYLGIPKKYHERKRYYNHLMSCLVALLKKAKETNDPLEKASLMINLAVMAKHCGGRYKEELEQMYEIAFRREPKGFKEMVEECLQRYAKRVCEHLVHQKESENLHNVHYVNEYLYIIGMTKIKDPLAPQGLKKHQIESDFLGVYTAHNIINCIEDDVNDKHGYISKDLMVEWFKDNKPQDFLKEKYDKIYSEYQEFCKQNPNLDFKQKRAFFEKREIWINPNNPFNIDLVIEEEKNNKYLSEHVYDMQTGKVKRDAIIYLLKEIGILLNSSYLPSSLLKNDEGVTSTSTSSV